MKDYSQTLCALRRLHAEIGGKIIDNRNSAKRLREDRRYVAAVIRAFSPKYDVKGIPAATVQVHWRKSSDPAFQ
jgi:hypothetical protein